MISPTGNDILLLGVDGGGTRCRARLSNWSGHILAQATAGPANIRLGLQESLAAVVEVTRQCVGQADLAGMEERIVACLALAGACEPATQTQAKALPLPFRRAILTSDARAACIGAHAGRDGAIVIVGTGSVAWGIAGGRESRAGGWGFPLSDEASGAWLGSKALALVLHAHDGLRPWTHLLRALFERYQADPYAIVRWMRDARPRDYASLAPLVCMHAEQGDVAALDLMRSAAAHIDILAARMADLGATPLSLLGGLAPSMEPYLADDTRRLLVPPIADAVSGALQLAREEAMASFAHSALAHD
jgi:glucosamine kinase